MKDNEQPLSLSSNELNSGFSKLSREERFAKLLQSGLLNEEDIGFLEAGGLRTTELAEHFIENVIGYFQLPLGLAMNFRIDGRDLVIPMAVEETSIIAAASKTAKWVRDEGSLTTDIIGSLVIGQIQLPKVKEPQNVRELIENHKGPLLETANQVAHGLVRRGGGIKDILVRVLPREDIAAKMVVLHILCDPCDAMGANIVNQVCEALKKPVEDLTGEKVGLCILSNLVDTRLTRAKIEIRDVGPELGRGIEEASRFAEIDPYRAATGNKGVMNGIDPIAIATGNDWRAIEAGIHAYAARAGRYSSITQWRYQMNESRENTPGTGILKGVLVAPIIVGTVGGVTKLHPTAQMGLRLMKVERATELSRIMAAVGLVQNLGALRALSTVGVVQGHMKLHAANLALMAGAGHHEVKGVQHELERIIEVQKRVSLQSAIDALERLRREKREFGNGPDISS